MSELLETIEDGVATLTMNRPEARNAMGGGMLDSLLEALPRLGADNSVRCVVLTGAGGAFCAGGDVKSFAEGSSGGGKPPTQEQRAQMLRPGFEIARLLHELLSRRSRDSRRGGWRGVVLALACDLRIALIPRK
ncbi:MAG: hypothetical protein CM15mP120_17990 [Pseudomonadota bacterium]|nr:MAG: hypothetical protein CM15mP120_17990 [Pseudomonadota bacterium]